MMRLVLIAAFIAVLVIAFNALLATMNAGLRMVTGKDDNTMPDTFKRIAFGALVILLIGLSSGFLGGL